MNHGVGGNAWIADRNTKLKLRLSLLEEDVEMHEPGVLTLAKAAKEAAKEDHIVNAALAKVAEFVSRAPPATALAPGAPAPGPAIGGSAPTPAQAFTPQDSPLHRHQAHRALLHILAVYHVL